MLAQHGWALARDGENAYWRRPGKTSGWSASLKDRVFYVFSANAAPFEPNRAYSPFSVYTLLNHGGDYEMAARSLRMSGYGGDCASDIPSDVDISGIMRMSNASGAPDSDNSNPGHMCDVSDDEAAPAAEIPDPGPMSDALLHIPGFIGEVMDHCLETAPYPNRVMAFAGALALLYAVSENHIAPRIGLAAVEWASAFVMHQTRRMLFMAAGHVAEGDFDALIKRAVEILRDWQTKNGPDALMPEWYFKRRLKNLKPSEFRDLVSELDARRLAGFRSDPCVTKPKSGYFLR